MTVVCFNKIINLDKFESVSFRTSLWGDEYPVEATRHETSGGLFGGVGTAVEEIARFKHEAVAQALVKAISDSWLANEQVFDVEKWKLEKASDYTPDSEPNPLLRKHQQTKEALLSIIDAQKNQEKILNSIISKNNLSLEDNKEREG